MAVREGNALGERLEHEGLDDWVDAWAMGFRRSAEHTVYVVSIDPWTVELAERIRTSASPTPVEVEPFERVQSRRPPLHVRASAWLRRRSNPSNPYLRR